MSVRLRYRHNESGSTSSVLYPGEYSKIQGFVAFESVFLQVGQEPETQKSPYCYEEKGYLVI